LVPVRHIFNWVLSYDAEGNSKEEKFHYEAAADGWT
jgi:hypothetical protein